jgi:glucose-6-phosphate isomerase
MKTDLKYIQKFVKDSHIRDLKEKSLSLNKSLHDKTGKGNDFLGWVNLPNELSVEFLNDIEATAASLRMKSDFVVVIGIGGSYLGAKAVIDALSHSFQSYRQGCQVVYAGQNIGEEYLFELREILKDKSFSLIVISKSGTTTEPAIAFRILKNDLETKYGKAEARNRIVAVTDEKRGALKQLSDTEGYKTYVIADNVGGRYSVLSPVGLLPVAVAGFNIHELAKGAAEMYRKTDVGKSFDENLSAQYAVVRNILYSKGYTTEIMVNFNPKLHFIAEWWKQLYGESEGKEGKGIFPAGVDFSTDLHSMGQYIQDGKRNLFETVISVAEVDKELTIPTDKDNLDQLNFLTGKRIDFINKNAELGTILAHNDGGVPIVRLEIPKLNEFYLGQLIYFFEKACGISGYLLDVNPFDQPGVEAYKKNMFALLEKPGFEGQREKLLNSL